MCNGITCIVLSVSLGGKKHGNGIQRCTQCNDRNFATKEIAGVCPCCNYRLRSHPRQKDLKLDVKVNNTLPFRNEIFFCIPEEFRFNDTVVKKIIKGEMKAFGRAESSSRSAFERFQRLMRQYGKALEIITRDDSGLTQSQNDYIEKLKTIEKDVKRRYARMYYYMRSWGPNGKEFREKQKQYKSKKYREMTPEEKTKYIETSKKRNRERYANDPEYRERVLAKNKEYHNKNKDRILAQRKKYYTRNQEKLKKKSSEYKRNRKKE